MTRPSVATPKWRVTLNNGDDITKLLSERLVSLTATCDTGDMADQLDIVLSNTDGKLQIPPTGAELSVYVGSATGVLTIIGRFTVDELEYSNPPKRLRITGRATDVAGAWQEKRERSWSGVTLGVLAASIAAEHNVTLRIAASLAEIPLTHVDQTNESNLNLLSRITAQHGATATVKAGYLLVLANGSSDTVSGSPLPELVINETECKQWRWRTEDRSKYTGVTCRWHNQDAANTLSITAGDEGRTLVLSNVFATEEEAVAAATAEFVRMHQASGSVTLELSRGDTIRQPLSPVRLSGFHALIDNTPWQIDKVVHKLDGNGGYSQSVELKVMA